MDSKEHIATLCALGTVGVAVAGLAFGNEPSEIYPVRPGKRKWPGSSTITSTSSMLSSASHGRRSVSYNLVGSKNMLDLDSVDAKPVSTTNSRGSQQGTSSHGADTPSRGSSATRLSVRRPFTDQDKDMPDEKDQFSRPKWLKRLSSLSISSSRASSPAASLQSVGLEHSASSPWLSSRPSTSALDMPNKLVKRSTSHRMLSQDQAKGSILPRPATSHQRLQTFRKVIVHQDRPQTTPNEVTTNQTRESRFNTRRIWRPYFESRYPRKRRRSEAAVDSNLIRTITPGSLREPTLILGTDLDKSVISQDPLDLADPVPLPKANTDGHRIRRTLGSLRRSDRHRHFTDPTVQISRTDARGTMSFTGKDSPISPFSDFSPQIEQHSMRGSPNLTSSPLVPSYDQLISFRKRHSMAPSEPLTASSDNDMRIFTDDDSMDFRSDSAYDSVATRATASSHSAMHTNKLETIFADRPSIDGEPVSKPEHADHNGIGLQLDHDMPDQFYDAEKASQQNGINGIDAGQESPDTVQDTMGLATPVRREPVQLTDMNLTPMPFRRPQHENDSSPPLMPSTAPARDYDDIDEMINDMTIRDNEIDDIDWSPKVENAKLLIPRWPVLEPGYMTQQQEFYSLPGLQSDLENATSSGIQRLSIFDWSENHQNHARPKTGVNQRSRSTGRKGPTQLHFRSQSVPVNREPLADEIQVPATTARYSTWKLGTKPVSEEWSDDFEFDDLPDASLTVEEAAVGTVTPKEPARSVRIPQSIIDRQPSVHLQFGQVQDFMLLVEELKRLRVRAGELRLLEGASRQLWEDAESIINLATINDDEIPSMLPSSPGSSDIFSDDNTGASRPSLDPSPFGESNRLPVGRRSVSNIGTPPLSGRARGESLVQAKQFLQAIHQTRNGFDSSPRDIEVTQSKKLPFDTQDLKDLVIRSGVITRALKEELRRAEGVSLSPFQTPPRRQDPPFSQMFRPLEPNERSPCPPSKKPGLPKSRSTNS